MGFFGDLGKALTGQQVGQVTPQLQGTSAPQSGGTVDASGRKIIPHITVKNLRSDRQGDRMTVRAWIVNESPDQIIRIDTSYLLKQKQTHEREINPGDSHELKLYDGPTPRDEHEHEAQIVYRLKANGDLFMEDYRIEYNLESDGSRTVEELHSDGPVRDI